MLNLKYSSQLNSNLSHKFKMVNSNFNLHLKIQIFNLTFETSKFKFQHLNFKLPINRYWVKTHISHALITMTTSSSQQ